jgi:chromodomain-helicase-DNA-binding protein 1
MVNISVFLSYCEDESDKSEEEEDEDDSEINSDDSEQSIKKSKKSKSKPKPVVKSVEDSNVETLEKVLRFRRGRLGATGSKTAIYNVEELGDPNLDEPLSSQFEDQYLIKWMGWSHLHNTWESKESLVNQKVNGMKKLDNFLRKEEEIKASKIESAMSPEDMEYMECQKEMMDNLLETHQILERVVATNKIKHAGGVTNVDYLCKWQGLPYSECTWEDGELIKKRFPPQVEEYDRRQAATTLAPMNVKSQKALRIRPRFVTLKEQPAYFGASDPDLKLRDYQLDGLNWLANSWCK